MKVFGITGWSGSGKTTLIERLLPALVARGLSVSVIKHTHHNFDIDKPGKDSHRIREAGAHEVLLAGDHRWVLMHELRDEAEPPLEAQLARMAPVDIVIVEGYKRAPMPKLEVWREEVGKPVRFPEDDSIVGVAYDGPPPAGCALPLLLLSDIEAIATFATKHALDVTIEAHARLGGGR
ncbi:molybdopterin-guanine dinucleotide biosynthesis protein B [Derxia gummosa]|uniref:Molybdopterin-guanine dinucleotide biosynthesis protein B n=1 Tax=Derxia gummosa DSM 723 TaxID=1121388 RepID=A0A8B6X7N5_9BURK|nr:molybdopterin-guanine dinucleotide biosynthesis protein B [Derxia gummosa]